MRSIPMADLGARLAPMQEDIFQAIKNVVASERFILGPEVEQLEQEIASLCSARHGIGVSSGTDALLVALMGLGIGPDDEVITTPLSFFASVSAILRLGAKPIFADIDAETFNLDPMKAVEKVTDRTKAIEVVHLFGQCAEVAPLGEILRERDITLVEDAAQAIGAQRDGIPAGSLGHVACFSFFPTKNLGALGDGGMVITSDDDLATKIRILRAHGARPKYYHHQVGGNFRLDAIQAAVLRVMLPHLDGWTKARQNNAELYDRLLGEAGVVDDGFVVPPPRAPKSTHVFHHYVVRIPHNREDLQNYLKNEGISTAVYYPLCFHQQPCLSHLGYGPGDFPQAEKASREVLALPIFPELTSDDITRVVDSISRFFRK